MRRTRHGVMASVLENCIEWKGITKITYDSNTSSKQAYELVDVLVKNRLLEVKVASNGYFNYKITDRGSKFLTLFYELCTLLGKDYTNHIIKISLQKFIIKK